MARKLDLSQLTEEEIEHVFHVVERDMNLRKKEDERLGDLKCRIEEEGTKRKFLTKQAKFNEGHCIHCLEPFQFLVNGKRRCLDCSLNTCKKCSKFNKKEYGWVCDSCWIIRIVNTGSLDWFYNHVKSRFKNFGSAKVMHSLNKRLQSGEQYPLQHLDSHSGEGRLDYASVDSYLQGGYNPQMMAEVIEEDEDTLDNSEAQRYSIQRKNKRLLSVHPFDFDMDSEYSAQSRRQSLQLSSLHFEEDDFQSFSELSFPDHGAVGQGSRRGSIENPALVSVFRSILQEKSQNLMTDPVFNTEVRLEINARRKSLEKSPKFEENEHHEMKVPHFQSIWVSTEEADLQQSLPYQKYGAQYYADMESSDSDKTPEHPVYHHHFIRHRSKNSSQENSGSAGSQEFSPSPHWFPPGSPVSSFISKTYEILDLSKRMSSIEQMLSRLEEKITPSSEKSPDPKGRHRVSSPILSEASGLDLTDADLEEEKLKKKLDELAGNISDKGLSSEEEPKRKAEDPREMSSSSDDLYNDTLKTMMVQQPPQRKISKSPGNKDSKTIKNETCERNVQHKGSLTQRNPSNKSRRLDHVFAKPVMSMRP
ncbi:melanophilin-like isoform X3 [Narcine bancroftii]|uniref:melanophilin-like isoform X3 n=1 Tax=Narcine bancroftii TaxID=1343680 RepID=UPI0038320F31